MYVREDEEKKFIRKVNVGEYAGRSELKLSFSIFLLGNKTKQFDM